MSTSCNTPVERDRERHEDQKYAHAPGEGQPASRTYGLVEEEAAHRVYNLRYGLVVGECPELDGHAAGGTKALLAKVSVKSQMKLVCCTPRRCTPGAS